MYSIGDIINNIEITMYQMVTRFIILITLSVV